MPSDSELTYGQSTAWQPERPRFAVFPLVVSWLAMGVALMVAAGLLPGVGIDSFWGALLVAAIVAALNAIIPPVLAALRLPRHARARLPARPVRRRRHPPAWPTP